MTAAIAGGSLTVAPSASAAESDCPSTVCLFENLGYSGRWVGFPSETANVGDYINDRTSSVVNRSDRIVCFFKDANYQGDLVFVIPPNTSTYYVGDGANDRITSFRFC